MRKAGVAIFIAVVLDIIVGIFTHEGLSTTSLHPLATNLLTLAIMSVFLIVEIIFIFSQDNKTNHR